MQNNTALIEPYWVKFETAGFMRQFKTSNISVQKKWLILNNIYFILNLSFVNFPVEFLIVLLQIALFGECAATMFTPYFSGSGPIVH